MLIDARQVRGTVRGLDTFRSASCCVGVSNIWSYASTFCSSIIDGAFRVNGTRVIIAWASGSVWDFWNFRTSYKSISLISFFTATIGWMWHYVAFSVFSTCIYAWVDTFLFNASFVLGTLAMKHAGRTAIWWMTDEICHTGTYRPSLFDLANWIGSARWRIAGVFWFYWFVRTSFNFSTGSEWIAVISKRTTTYRIMIKYFTKCVNSTSLWAWIWAFVVDASLILSTFAITFKTKL